MKITKELSQEANEMARNENWGQGNNLLHCHKIGVSVQIILQQRRERSVVMIKIAITKVVFGENVDFTLKIKNSYQIKYTINGGEEYGAKNIKNNAVMFYGTEEVNGRKFGGFSLPEKEAEMVTEYIAAQKKREQKEEERIVKGLISGDIKIEIKDVGCYYRDWQPWVNEKSWHQYSAQGVMSRATRQIVEKTGQEMPWGSICDALKKIGGIKKECAVSLPTMLQGYKTKKKILDIPATHCWECGCKSDNLDEDGYCGC